MWSNPDSNVELLCHINYMCQPMTKWHSPMCYKIYMAIHFTYNLEIQRRINHKSLSHNAEYKNKFTDDFFLLLAWMSVFSSGHPHCKTCHSSDGNENNFRSAVQANSQSQYLHRIEVSRIFPSNLRKTNRFFIKDGWLYSDFFPGKILRVVQTQPILFLKSMSETVGSDRERLWIWICNRFWVDLEIHHSRS